MATVQNIVSPHPLHRNDCISDSSSRPAESESIVAATAREEDRYSPQKPKHYGSNLIHREVSDETVSTTSLSSCSLTFRSSRDEAEEDDDDDVLEQLEISCRRTIIDNDTEEDDDAASANMLRRHTSVCSSFYSAVATEQPEDEDTKSIVRNRSVANEMTTASFPLELDPCMDNAASPGGAIAASSWITNDAILELTERAHRMLQREAEHEIVDYFHQASFSTAAAAAATARYARIGDTSCLPIDASCRSKMMDWSFRVVEYSFPHKPTATAVAGTRSRKYSIQAIQIVSQAFELIDRLSTLYHIRDKKMLDRSQYKLICMMCLHLAAKTCGLFGLYDGEKEYVVDLDEDETEEEEECTPYSCQEEENDEDTSHALTSDSSDSSWSYPLSGQDSWHEVDDDANDCESPWYNSTSSLSFSSMATSSAALSSQCDEGQTIVGTPEVEKGTVCCQQLRRCTNTGKASRRKTRTVRMSNSRPPLNLLSLSGMSTLCKEEFTMDQLIQAERAVLQRLDWKMTTVTSLDWCQWLFEVLEVCMNAHDAKDNYVRNRQQRSRDDGFGKRTDTSKKSKGMVGSMMETVWEHTLTHLESAIDKNRLVPPSLAAWSAVVRALEDCSNDRLGHRLQRVMPMYKEVIRDILPSYGEEEVNGVRLGLNIE
eukprot:CAMPEP_0183707084 /NCGR_PEP_ID=MMETSP0737-20130205/3748_1 /TAXON_ID=385413 /ORGANISM="Thalassiosira miniscula, Strain CCMP1093" /LENGTH=655 /DNA_ID=CAMNT_0025934659 /DNA_START=190 /DNA_END=2154 /DNA_ORIENTATION=+